MKTLEVSHDKKKNQMNTVNVLLTLEVSHVKESGVDF